MEVRWEMLPGKRQIQKNTKDFAEEGYGSVCKLPVALNQVSIGLEKLAGFIFKVSSLLIKDSIIIIEMTLGFVINLASTENKHSMKAVVIWKW